ncbi:unnamed protein product [Rhizoctonia solani]|uniref:Uncharacterized protein n=1 Tax=Rhizoctonia solani TaxID=456999 RepID=A0A8H3HSL2_9AGAM|nr:unnamed protein product [Rhizoctonia solani]
MGDAGDPIVALVAAKIAEDPRYLQRILAQATGLAQPPPKESTKGQAKALNSKLHRTPTAKHDSDNEVAKELQRKCKATETQSTAAHVEPSHKKIMDEEQCQEQPRIVCPKMRPLPAPEPTVNPTPQPAEPEDRRVTADKQPKKKPCQEKESTFKLTPKSPAASTPISSLKETASEPIANTGNRVVRATKMMITVPNTRNLCPHK